MDKQEHLPHREGDRKNREVFFAVIFYAAVRTRTEGEMAKKLYVGNLSYNMTEDDLRDTFSKVGEVSSAKVIVDQATGRSKGFGFVEMATDEDAAKVIATLNGTAVLERTITVSEARPQKDRPRPGFGGDRFGGGGYGRRR